MKNDNFHTFFALSWLQMLNLPALLQKKNTRIGPFPWKWSVLQNPDRERTNQSTGICLGLGLPYNNNRVFGEALYLSHNQTDFHWSTLAITKLLVQAWFHFYLLKISAQSQSGPHIINGKKFKHQHLLLHLTKPQTLLEIKNNFPVCQSPHHDKTKIWSNFTHW